MAKPQIEPRILKGFRDLLPNEAGLRLKLFEIIRGVFETSCYSPIDTPALEYTEILLGKGSDETDKQLFRFNDQGGRDISLRFDLTVPLARFASQHRSELNFPFRRYHIAPVWRAEKPQKGRYREFFQCDFDIIGTDSKYADIETLQTVGKIFEKIGLKYRVRINNRKVLNSVIQALAPNAPITDVLRAIDKLEKLGTEVVKEELISKASLDSTKAENLISFVLKVTGETNNQSIVQTVSDVLKNSEAGLKDLNDFSELLNILEEQDLKLGKYVFDLSIARGLDYYTGVVFETQLIDNPSLGSVCSGGRYDNLASLFSSQELPGVGGSVGIDRLMVALEGGNSNYFLTKNNIKVLVCIFSNELAPLSFKVGDILRNLNVPTEIYSSNSKMGAQLKFADKAGFTHAIIIGPDEASSNSVQVKNLTTDSKENQILIPISELGNYFKVTK